MQALAWLDRAVRYAPDDPTPRLSLAAARLAAGDAALAAEAFAAVTRQVDVREAWLGLAIAALRLGDGAGAATAIGRCLAAHRWLGPDALADAACALAGHDAWCGLGPDERLALSPRTDPATLTVRIDGAPWLVGRTVPAGTRQLAVAAGRTPLLGSPIDVAAIRRIEGIVAEAQEGGLEGWAWHPADPQRDPVLQASDGKRRRPLVATDLDMAIPRPLMRPRRFALSRADLEGFAQSVHVASADGQALAGSPVRRGLAERAAAEAAARVAVAFPLAPMPRGRVIEAGFAPAAATLRGAPARAVAAPERPVIVVVPAYRGAAETMACLAAVRRTLPAGGDVVVVDDATPEPDLAQALDDMAARGLIRLARNARNLGFPGAANVGLRLAAARHLDADLVVLNSDTVPAPGWIETLRAAVHAEPDIGTATPLSNDASILGYPDPEAPAPAPDPAALQRLGRIAAKANPGLRVDIPTAVGFCMYLRRECLAQVGVFREDLFARGYGEENDFCLRARHLGWRHVAVPAAYVAHVGGRSFGAGREALLRRNADILERLHPGYEALIAAWKARDPLAPARAALDAALWRDRARRPRRGEAVLLITHDSGGGVERCVQARRAAIEASGGLAILLRPVLDRSGTTAALDRAYLPGLCRIAASEAVGEPWPALTCTLPEGLGDLAGLLRLVRPQRVEVHHLLGHQHAVLELAERLGIPGQVHIHDYAWFCPRVNLVGAGGRYCGEPDLAGCAACIADLGSRLEEEIGVAELVRRSQADLGRAARVVTPSADAARRIARHFPGIRPDIEPHETPAAAPDMARPPRRQGHERRICVVGAIGQEKGFDVLLGCARDAAARRLALRFHVVGHTIDDARLIDTGTVSITGPYRDTEAAMLIRAQNADIGFIPSVWPETWCFALSEAWNAGLSVAAFDIGAQAERIRGSGRGWLLPLALPAHAVNNALLTLSPLAADESVMQTVC